MKRCLLLLTVMLCTSLQAADLPWKTFYGAAVEEAKKTDKPILLYFTGSDWCPWCARMQEEVLSTDAFVEAVGDKFVWVWVDEPRRTKLTRQQMEHNEDLRGKFEVNGLPTLVLSTAAGDVISRSGYRQGGGEAYAAYLMDNLKQYLAAGTSQFSAAIMGAAAARGKGSPVALLVRYRDLLNEGKRGTPEAIVLREQLVESVPYEVAMTDYEQLTAQPDADRDVDTAIAPLVAYLGKHGSTDRERSWKVRMMVSQLLLGEGDTDRALQFAKEALREAPGDHRAELRSLVKSIEAQRSTQ